jgi:uncharacterized protein with HEPN domain
MRRERNRDAAYLTEMIGFAREVVTYATGESEESYLADPRLRRAIERCIELIGEAASNLTPEFQQAHPEVPWRLIIDQRHILVHAYAIVDDRRIWSRAAVEVPALVPVLEQILRDTTAEP